MARALDPAPVPPGLSGEQPVDVYICHALAENRGVQAARFNLLAMKQRIPQETALEDPMVQNTIWPFPSNSPQYSLMGYMPYELMITQQFPWFGTLKLRGQAAEQEAKAAFYELLAAQLEVVSRVKRAYYNIYFNQRAELILADNQKLAEDFVVLARERLKSGTTTLQDVLRAQNIVTDVESELVTVRQELAGAKAALARQLHVSPEADLRALSEMPIAQVPAQVEMLYRLAAAARPELQGRLAAVARDERQVEIARKRYYPNITAGLAYGMMTRVNSMSSMADGRDNVGFVVGFNLPIYQQKIAAGVSEAKARAIADSRRYDDLRDETYEEVKEFYLEAKARRDVLELFRTKYLPRAENVLELATNDYRVGNQDFLTLITGLRELLAVRLQIARLESELGKALASLERIVGVQLNEHPPTAIAAPTEPVAIPPQQPPLPAAGAGPFAPEAVTTEPRGSDAPNP
ncbi:TolC family protein [Singulisphaera sp. Ch08]|uniref:TolC family protein n=1 Tax=Singulisphaera sp. Ch08 TaxID=3120278 RepID=A0AAU7CCS5_9BACT